MGLFKRKPKPSASAVDPRAGGKEGFGREDDADADDPLSPPRARYANTRSASTSSAASVHGSVRSYASAPSPAGGGGRGRRAESPLPPVPIPAATAAAAGETRSFPPSPHRLSTTPYSLPSSSYDTPPTASFSAAAAAQAQAEQAEAELLADLAAERRARAQRQKELDDPSRWTLPALGLSPPSSLVPLALDGKAPSPTGERRGSAWGREAEGRSFRGAMSDSPVTNAAPTPPFLAPPIAPSSSRSSSPSTNTPSSATPTSASFFPPSSGASSYEHAPPPMKGSSVYAAPRPLTAYADGGSDNDDGGGGGGGDKPLARPPPLAGARPDSASSSAGPLSLALASSGKLPRKSRFLGLFTADAPGRDKLPSGGRSSGGASAGQDDGLYGMAYESYRPHAAPTPVGPSVSPSRARAPLPRRPSATRRSPSLGFDTAGAAELPPAVPRPTGGRPAGSRSTSFFSNALCVTIPSSSASKTSPAASELDLPPPPARPKSPAESFRVISARRITTPDEALLSASVSASAVPDGGWLGARPLPTPVSRPGSGERKRSQSYEWTRPLPAPLSPPSRAGEAVEQLQSPEKDVGGREAERERRMSVAAFRRRRSSAGFDVARSGGAEEAKGEVLVIGREGRAGAAAALASAGSALADDSDDEDDKPLFLLRSSAPRAATPTHAPPPPLQPPFAPAPLPRSGSTADLAGALAAAPSSGGRRGFSLSVPSPLETSGEQNVKPTPEAKLKDKVQAPPPRSSSLQSLALFGGGERPEMGRREPAADAGLSAGSSGARSVGGLPGQSPAPSTAPLPVGTRPLRAGGPAPRPASRYELAKAAAAARKPAPAASEGMQSSAASSAKAGSAAASASTLSSSSSEDDRPLARPTSRASAAFRPRSPATSLKPSLAGKSPREPLLTLPKELEKPVLDRRRSVRRASVGDADQILADVQARAEARDRAGARGMSTTVRGGEGASGVAGRTLPPVARRRGSESVMYLFDKPSPAAAAVAHSDTSSDDYGTDEVARTPTGSLPAATAVRPSFFKHRSEEKAVGAEGAKLEIPPVAVPLALAASAPRAATRAQAADSDSDSDDQPLNRCKASTPSPGPALSRPLTDVPQPTVRVTATTPKASLPLKAPGRPAHSRRESTASLSSLASTSSDDEDDDAPLRPPASQQQLQQPSPPKSILRRTSFADDQLPPPDMRRASMLPSPLSRPTHVPRSASASSIPSLSTATHPPPRPAFHAGPREAVSPASSSASGRTTGGSSSGIMPVTPRESLESARMMQGRRTPSFGGAAGEKGLAEVEVPDEAELERRRNERRRNEAKKAVQLGNYANGSAPHPDRADDDDLDDEPSQPSHGDLASATFPQQHPFAPSFGASPFGASPLGPMPFPGMGAGMPGFMDPNALWAMQVGMQAQQAQLAMQMSMAQLGGDPNMHYQAMMMAKQQFAHQMAAQALQMANDQWELSSNFNGPSNGGGSAMSEAGYPTSSIGTLGMGLPSGFNPGMNRFPSGGSMYGGGGGPGYAASAYGGGGPDMSSWPQQQHLFLPQQQQQQQAYPSSRSDYGGVAPARRQQSRDRLSAVETPSQPALRESFYGAVGAGGGGYAQGNRSSTHLGGPAADDYYQQSRIPQQGQQQQQQQQASHARPRMASGPSAAQAHHRTSLAGNKPLVSFSASPPRTARLEREHDARHQQQQQPHVVRSSDSRQKTHSSSASLRPLAPPLAPFAREGRSPGLRSGSPGPPSSWKGSV